MPWKSLSNFHRSPEQLGPDHIREYQVHPFGDRKLSPGAIEGRASALRFLYVKTLRLPEASQVQSSSYFVGE